MIGKGSRIVARDDAGAWDPSSGQCLFDWPAPNEREVAHLPHVDASRNETLREHASRDEDERKHDARDEHGRAHAQRSESARKHDAWTESGREHDSRMRDASLREGGGANATTTNADGAAWPRRTPKSERSDGGGRRDPEQSEGFRSSGGESPPIELLDPAELLELGLILHGRNDAAGAASLYERAIVSLADHALAVTAYFNLGVAREDLGDPVGALQAYRAALELDSRCADAHYNAARLCELAGDQVGALRHLRAYSTCPSR